MSCTFLRHRAPLWTIVHFLLLIISIFSLILLYQNIRKKTLQKKIWTAKVRLITKNMDLTLTWSLKIAKIFFLFSKKNFEILAIIFQFFVSLVNVHYDFKSEKWLDGETQENRFPQTSTNPGPNTGHRMLMT